MQQAAQPVHLAAFHSTSPCLQSTFDNALLKSALISGSLSLIGDMVAQTLANRSNPGTASYDAARAMRMGTFGLFFYGPYQHYWYRALDRSLPGRSVSSFLGKVALNQFCLAPVVIAAVFAWNLGLQGKLEQFTEKAKSDFIPTMITGWKFWVPAASINFTLVPLQQQVLYMSACGIVWTAILSSSSTQSQKSPVAAKKAK